MVTHIPAPEGYTGNYRFFLNPETNKTWKARLVRREARPALVDNDDGVELATGEYAVTITVSPVDEAGQALLEEDCPIVIDSHTHSFTNYEMSDADFNAEVVIHRIVEQCIELGEARLRGVGLVKTIADNWAS